MDYQKLLTEEQISNIYVAEGDIVSFFNSEGKLCTKNHEGIVTVLENSGKEGEDGITPHIGSNGNWFIGEEDTGVKAKGEDGKNGENGADGERGEDGIDGEDGITPHIGSNGNWFVGDEDTGVPARGEKGADGKNGTNGTNGKDGIDGTDGEDGITPHIGDNGNWFIGDEDTGLNASGMSEALESVKIKIDEIVNDKIEISFSYFPVAIQTQKGNVYPIEKNTLIFNNNKWMIDIKAYLVYDNVSEFTPSWTVYCAGGYNPPIIAQFDNTGSFTHTMSEREYLYHKKDCALSELNLNINKNSNNSCICFNTGNEFIYTINISDDSDFYLGGGAPNFQDNSSYIVAVDNMTIIWSTVAKYE